jgi:putative NADH-flavin reductase
MSMSKVLILGATGSLGRYVTQQAIAANHAVSAVVRTPSKLPAELREKVVVHQADLATKSVSDLATIFRNHDAVINTAGLVTEGQVFVDLVERIVTGLESLPHNDRPVCWFLGGAALLDLDDRGRRGVDLPRIAATYWPHRANFERIRQTALDWRILCPGPMVLQQPLGLARMRISLDRMPVQVPSFTRFLPRAPVLPFFVYRVPEMIVSYADAAALMLANLTRSGEMSGRRVGLALPVGMRGRKAQWAATPKAA